MPFHTQDQIQYYSFDLFKDAPVTHGVFTRHGGVSKGQWHSLNMGLSVGDDPADVQKNRHKAFAVLNRPWQSLSDSWLVHGDGVLVYKQPRSPEQTPPLQGDIILTNRPDVTLFMRYADCVPVLLVDPVKKAIALAHAGWKGTVLKVAKKAVEALGTQYGSRPEDVLAAIGPSIGPEHYEVGQDVVDRVQAAFGTEASSLLPQVNGSPHFDLWSANRIALQQAGVEQIEVAGICTYKHRDDWFSHRGDNGKTGRFGVLLALEE